MFLQEEEQKRLEMEMQKRRERIEYWRAERKKKQELISINIVSVSKKWLLEDEDDDDEEEVQEKSEENGDEVDFLDVYMQVCVLDNGRYSINKRIQSLYKVEQLFW